MEFVSTAERRRYDMAQVAKAWWRGKRVAAAGHDLKIYEKSLGQYSEAERDAFLAGYANQPQPTKCQ